MLYQIHKASESDLPLMKRLFYQTVTSYGAQLFTKEEIKFYSKLAIDKQHWEQKFITDFVYNAKLNGEIIGSFSLTQDGRIDYIFVHKNYQNQGIASGLYNKIEEIARKNSIRVLSTPITPSTEEFFRKKGYNINTSEKKVAGGETIYNLTAVKYI